VIALLVFRSFGEDEIQARRYISFVRFEGLYAWLMKSSMMLSTGTYFSTSGTAPYSTQLFRDVFAFTYSACVIGRLSIIYENLGKMLIFVKYSWLVAEEILEMIVQGFDMLHITFPLEVTTLG